MHTRSDIYARGKNPIEQRPMEAWTPYQGLTTQKCTTQSGEFRPGRKFQQKNMSRIHVFFDCHRKIREGYGVPWLGREERAAKSTMGRGSIHSSSSCSSLYQTSFASPV